MRLNYKLVFILLVVLQLIACTSNNNGNKNYKNMETSEQASYITSNVDEDKQRLDSVVFEQDSNQNLLRVKEYSEYLESLSKSDYRSIKLALNRFLELVTKDKNSNDMMFKDFYSFYNTIFNNIHDTLEDLNFDESELMKNGFEVKLYEEGNFIFQKSDFLKENFINYVSDGTAEFIMLDDKDREVRNGGFLITDALLVITRNELSDLIVEWERYINNYPSYKWECMNAKDTIEFYIKIYSDIELMTFSDMNGETELSTDILQSYKRFIDNYAYSIYYEFIREYYDELIKNGVTVTDATTKLLIKFNIID